MTVPPLVAHDALAGGARMKIAQVNLASDYGGAERHALILSRGLRDAGHSVHLFCHPRGGLRRDAERLGLSTASVASRNQIDVRAAVALAARLRAIRPDVLHLHTPRDYVAGTFATRMAGVPVATVITRHMDRPVKPIMRRVYGEASAVICLTRIVRDGLRAGGVSPEKLALIPGAIDTAEFAAAGADAARRAAVRAEWGLDDAAAAPDCAVGVVGRLVGGKGHGCFLAAAARLADTPAAVAKFLIVGEGPERAALEAEAGRLGVADGRVLFTGFRGDVPAVLAALDILVLPSTDAEVLPLVVMEALAAGRPVVATSVGGVPEMIEDGVSGLLVPPGDADALAEALRRLIKDAPLRARLAGAGRECVERRFTLARMVSETERVYRRLYRCPA